MGSWYMILSDYMGGGCLRKFNSMGGGVQDKVPSSPSRYFFSGIALYIRTLVGIHVTSSFGTQILLLFLATTGLIQIKCKEELNLLFLAEKLRL